ncbi:unnamed protein product [Didymodactylos carnosus]|uniref:Uncharacterized protein n=1 Tax=Didymodactylos carnosus TaxID=1234261 RepID=A0A815SQJ0_9BILA|nr:unnamed protein product [Didymodactylos carnosus]CAF1496662.1 unnamed protein product [Didymodactylos carnosus]CAF4052672.1 unnamed protein product [Didymodactylos carnosus]CAF4359072.1 unnamed protein product [Didymodactylos carnosus]
MASSVAKKCEICQKAVGSHICPGCKILYCKTDFAQHRRKLTDDMEKVTYEHDLIFENYFAASLSNDKSDVMEGIDKWENETIEKVKIAAEQAREKAVKLINDKRYEGKREFAIISGELCSGKESGDYTELELKRWTEHLKQLKAKMQSSTITLRIQTIDWANVIEVGTNKSTVLSTRKIATSLRGTNEKGGIFLNLSLSDLSNWHIVYETTSLHQTTARELRDIANYCTNKRIIVGAIDAKSANVLTVAAIGPSEVLALHTPRNQPAEHDGVWWYLTPNRSFGFSPTSKIRQYRCDIEKSDGDKRLSWCLDGYHGGYRAGNIDCLTEITEWRKIILCEN